jgi:hypothetical protein
MNRLFIASCAALAITAAAPAIWSENFDSYDVGTKMDGVGGWFGWNDVGSAAGTIVDDFSRSAPNSIGVSNSLGEDAVHPFTPITEGPLILTAYQYIPAGLDGLTYFIMNNVYVPNGDQEWAIEMHMDPATGMVNENIHDADGVYATPIVYDEWVEIRVEIDLDADFVDAYYNGESIWSGAWTSASYPTLEFANIDLYAPHDMAVYYDDFNLVIPAPGALAMLGMAGLFGVRRRRA